jgi:hypothetical protein
VTRILFLVTRGLMMPNFDYWLPLVNCFFSDASHVVLAWLPEILSLECLTRRLEKSIDIPRVILMAWIDGP